MPSVRTDENEDVMQKNGSAKVSHMAFSRREALVALE
jgi:hypothetical protein